MCDLLGCWGLSRLQRASPNPKEPERHCWPEQSHSLLGPGGPTDPSLPLPFSGSALTGSGSVCLPSAPQPPIPAGSPMINRSVSSAGPQTTYLITNTEQPHKGEYLSCLLSEAVLLNIRKREVSNILLLNPQQLRSDGSFFGYSTAMVGLPWYSILWITHCWQLFFGRPIFWASKVYSWEAFNISAACNFGFWPLCWLLDSSILTRFTQDFWSVTVWL